MHRRHLAYGRDAALLTVRLLLGTVLFAHGYQKLVVNGIGRTTEGFEHMSIPVAIVSASFVTVVEAVGGLLLLAGLLTTAVAVLQGVVMAGAAAFVHARHGIFVADGGWELVGSLGAALAALAVAGPGRWSVAHVLGARRERTPVPDPAGTADREPAPAAFAEPIPPAGLPLVPLVRLAPAPVRPSPTFAGPPPNRDLPFPPRG